MTTSDPETSLPWVRSPATMPEEHFEALRRAREHFLSTGTIEPSIRPFVAGSWERCRAAGVHPHKLRTQVVDPERARSVQARGKALLEAAEPVLREVEQIVGDHPHMLALADAEGVILKLFGDPVSLGPDGVAANLFEGASWAEGDIGCNGVGTALRAGAPVVLAGAEHYQEAYLGWTCIGIPLRTDAGQFAGVLDFSVPNEHVSAHTWGWMLSVARAIEDRLRLGDVAGAMPPEPDRPFDSVRGILEMIGSHLNPEEESGPDIRELKREVSAAEEQLMAALAGLRKRSEQLESVTRDKEESMAALAHELRGPLFAVVSCIDLLRSNGHDQETVDWARDVMERQASQMRALVDDLMDLSRAERGKLALNWQELDLRDVVDQAVLTVAHEMRECGVSLERNVPHILLRADRTRLVQVLTNLLGNAVRYNRQGGRITLIAHLTGPNEVEICIADTGVGIEPELLPRIFEPFVQGRLKKRGGLGLGLPLVNRLVQLHGGSISIRSDGIDKGSEFIIRLPTHAEVEPRAAAPDRVQAKSEMAR